MIKTYLNYHSDTPQHKIVNKLCDDKYNLSEDIGVKHEMFDLIIIFYCRSIIIIKFTLIV